jgi:hypothetical protein
MVLFTRDGMDKLLAPRKHISSLLRAARPVHDEYRQVPARMRVTYSQVVMSLCRTASVQQLMDVPGNVSDEGHLKVARHRRSAGAHNDEVEALL